MDRSISRSLCMGVMLAMAIAPGPARAALPDQEFPPSSQQAKATDPAGLTITIATGQITDVIGAGQKDVLIEAFLKNEDGTAGRPVAQTKTDAMGDFTLVAHEKIEAKELVITFTKDRFAPLTKTIEWEEGKPPFVGEALAGNLRLSGTVVGAADNKPVIAKVVFENMFTRLEATTGADGRFEFAGLSPMQARLEVTAPGFGREQKNIRVPLAEPLSITLKPERRVTLRVTDEEGDAIAGAVLECLDAARHDFRTLISDDNGTATITGLHFDAKTLTIHLSHDQFVASGPRGEIIELPATSPESSHQLMMRRAGRITGQVRSATSNAPLYGARVFAGDAFSDTAPRDWTDADGNFTLTEVSPGPMTVTVHFAGYAPELKSVEVAAGKSASVEFALAEAKTIRGRVKNPSGDPVGGVEVAATKWREKTTLGLRAMTDHDGRFVLENAPTDEFEICVFGRGLKLTKTVGGSSSEEIDLTVEDARPPKELAIGEKAPTFKLTMLDGQSISNETLKNKTTLVIFWATWCGPCLAEVPRLVEVYEKFRGRNDFVMIGLSRDFEEAALRDHLKSNPKIAWIQAFGEAGGVDDAAEAFGVTGIPSIFLLDPAGKIAATDLRDEEIMATVEKALKAGTSP